MFRKGSISALRYHCARPIPICYRTITCQKIRMSASGPVQQLMIDYQSRYPIRAKSLIATIFGDDVAAIVAGELGGNAKPSTIRDLVTGKVMRD